MIIKTVSSIFATLGFCILFNIKGKNLLYASLGGGLGWFVYMLGLNMHFSVTASMFLASIVIGIYSEVMARVHKAPVTIFVVCALIPLVPGGGMYYTMLESITGSINTSLHLGLETLTNAGALAIGIVLTSSLSKFVSYRRRPNNKVF
ncbi:MAG: threonine/serine exporter family protein [Bacillota bacterium]|nr:threonine/serine exporter family protein [Bacillota bacterium]